MNASLLAVLNDAERLLVAQPGPAELAEPDWTRFPGWAQVTGGRREPLLPDRGRRNWPGRNAGVERRSIRYSHASRGTRGPRLIQLERRSRARDCAMRGATSGQLGTGSADTSQTGPPCSHLDRSGVPEVSRGVWHWLHTARPSTMYFPRATTLSFG